jgi:hypothetical protein
MDDTLQAEWYDLKDGERQEFLDWLHGTHLPRVQARNGILWVGHYGLIARTRKTSADPGGPLRSHVNDPTLPTGGEYLLLTAAATPDVFFDPHRKDEDAETKRWLAKRVGHRQSIFITEARVNGPEYRALMPGAGAPPAMQLGNFITRKPEDDWELGRWYRQLRFPQITRTRGCIAVRKLVGVAGWAKHGVLYEFTGMDPDEENFEKRFRDAADTEKWEGRHVLEYVLHGPGRHGGPRLWPALPTKN